MYVYKTTNLINGKIYIGVSTRPVDESKSYYGSGYFIMLAIKKYGIENFSKEILKLCTDKKDLSTSEVYYISKYNTTNREIGYNILEGGYGGNGHYKRSKEHLEKMSSAVKKSIRENWNDPKQIKARSLAVSNRNKTYCTGKKLTQEHKSKVAEGCRKRFLGTTQKKTECPHCGKIGGASNMTRYHFNNCKNKPK